jgi:hypothetical protein
MTCISKSCDAAPSLLPPTLYPLEKKQMSLPPLVLLETDAALNYQDPKSNQYTQILVSFS